MTLYIHPCSENAIYLEEKQKEEKELRNQAIAEADEFNRAFNEKRQKNREANKALNIESEKVQCFMVANICVFVTEWVYCNLWSVILD